MLYMSNNKKIIKNKTSTGSHKLHYKLLWRWQRKSRTWIFRYGKKNRSMGHYPIGYLHIIIYVVGNYRRRILIWTAKRIVLDVCIVKTGVMFAFQNFQLASSPTSAKLNCQCVIIDINKWNCYIRILKLKLYNYKSAPLKLKPQRVPR